MTLEGERIRGSLHGAAAADWLVVTNDGRLGLMDVRCTIATDDGALIFMQYHGRMRYAQGEEPHELFVAPRFETGSARYAWLNGVQAAGKGLFDRQARVIDYQLFEVA